MAEGKQKRKGVSEEKVLQASEAPTFICYMLDLLTFDNL